jgi:hypothetical protein
MRNFILAAVMTLSLFACKPGVDPEVQHWIGLWTGPEGTSLVVTSDGGNYNVIIKNLDGPRHFPATAEAQGLSFTRDGSVETIHHGSGPQTGMKWLTEKKNCLIVKPGEGFCRD